MTDSDTPAHSPPLVDANWLLRAADAQAEFGHHPLAADIRRVAERLKAAGSTSVVLPHAPQVIDKLQILGKVWCDPEVVAAFDATAAFHPPPDLVSESDGAMDEQGRRRDPEPDPTI